MKTVGRRRTLLRVATVKATVTTMLPLLPIMLLLSWMLPYASAADDCATMLKPTFDLLKQPIRHDIPAAVYATVTKQYASGNNYGAPDLVEYANGQLAYGMVFWGGHIGYFADTFYGTIPSVSNLSQFIPGKFSLNLAVNASGGISVQELLSGQPIGGMPPQVFQGTCSAGLVTVIAKNIAWIISFTTTPPQDIK